MKIAITGASGLIGSALARSLVADGHTVVPVVRRTVGLAEAAISWDPQAGAIDAAGFTGVDGVVHLAGAGIGDHRWNDAYKREVLESRTKGTELLTRTLASLETPPSVLVSGSAIGIYGDTGDTAVTEHAPHGRDFLASVCTQWEAAARPAVDAGIRTAFLRTGIVLTPDGGALAKLLRGREARSAAAAAGVPRLLVLLVQRLTSSISSSSSSAAAPAAAAPSVPATPQLAYDLCISLWQLALTPRGAEAAVAAGAVPALTDVLRAAVAAKEKVVRAAAQALKALLVIAGGEGGSGSGSGAGDAAVPSTSSSSAPSSSSSSSSSSSATATAAGAAAVSCGLARVCDALLAQQWDDPDVAAALRACREGAIAAARRACSWPAYRAEVLGGRLTWGPAHEGPSGGAAGGSAFLGTSDAGPPVDFWSANARRLEERDAEVLRSLVRLLSAPSSDATTLAVACSDLARYADASGAPDRARALLTSLGANAHATRLLAHADPEVRRHALAAVQRIVLSRDKLQYLNS